MPTDLSHPAEGDTLVERKALRDELVATADQLVRAETQAGFAGPDTAVRVKDPGHLASVLRRAAGALEVRTVASLSAEVERLKGAVAERDEKWGDYPALKGRLLDRERSREAEQRACREAIDRASAAEARAERLEEALRPFCFGDPTLERILFGHLPDEATGTITVKCGDFRRARAALSKNEETGR